jgi:hypothetical protein
LFACGTKGYENSLTKLHPHVDHMQNSTQEIYHWPKASYQ